VWRGTPGLSSLASVVLGPAERIRLSLVHVDEVFDDVVVGHIGVVLGDSLLS
jgi:hypothetical protein